jgi:hypothetical protein
MRTVAPPPVGTRACSEKAGVAHVPTSWTARALRVNGHGSTPPKAKASLDGGSPREASTCGGGAASGAAFALAAGVSVGLRGSEGYVLAYVPPWRIELSLILTAVLLLLALLMLLNDDVDDVADDGVAVAAAVVL